MSSSLLTMMYLLVPILGVLNSARCRVFRPGSVVGPRVGVMGVPFPGDDPSGRLPLWEGVSCQIAAWMAAIMASEVYWGVTERVTLFLSPFQGLLMWVEPSAMGLGVPWCWLWGLYCLGVSSLPEGSLEASGSPRRRSFRCCPDGRLL